jgi:ATP-dependent exoDNAse (exonuclease V) alpha subunit
MSLTPKLQALVEAARAKHAMRQAGISPAAVATAQAPANNTNHQSASSTSHSAAVLSLKPTVRETSISHVLTSMSNYVSVTGIQLNEKQQSAVELAMRGKSFNLCGAAGTGKTTTTREIIGQLVRMPHVSPIKHSTKYLTAGDPGVVIISFTNKAVNNIRKQLPPGLQSHCMTYHKLLEFKPMSAFDPLELNELGYGEYIDPEGKVKRGGMFIPSMNKITKLPHLSVIIVEESSMVDTDLHSKLIAALPDPANTQLIFLGDLNQLPPIFGPSILGFKLVEQDTVELDHVYRQALQSPIITLAHMIREGRGIPGRLEEKWADDRGENGKVTIQPWKKKLESATALKTVLELFLLPMFLADDFNFDEVCVLCPFNKQFGTLSLNRAIAHALSQKRGEETHEVIARYQRSYWAVSDRVIVDRQDAVIVDISPNPAYDGPIASPSSMTMDREGKDTSKDKYKLEEDMPAEFNLDQTEEWDPLSSLILSEGEKSQNAASHIITVKFSDTGQTSALSSSGQINAMIFSYVLTVHKSQGSEWRKVILLLHYTHNTMVSRELIYTAVTRARHELHVICEPDRGLKSAHIPNTLTRAAKNPEIKGVTLAEKAEYFQAKKSSYRPSRGS